MKNRNCPNCGAPLEIDKIKCPYCGTSYFDISCIPTNKPFFLSMSLDNNKKIIMKAITTGATVETETVDVLGGYNNKIGQYINSSTIKIEFNILGE